MFEALRRRVAAPWHAKAQLHVGLNGLRLRATGSERRRAEVATGTDEVLRAGDEPLAQALAPLLQEGAAKLGRAVADVSLDDRLVRIFSVTPPMGARGLGDLRAAAHRRFGLLYGDALDAGWCLDAVWRSNGPFIAVAMPRTLRDTLMSALSAAQWPVRSIAPVFARELHARRRALGQRSTWLIVRSESGDAVTVGVRLPDGDRVRSTTLPTEILTEAGALASWVEGEALLLDVERPRTMVLTGADGRNDLGAAASRDIDGITILSDDGASVAPSIGGHRR